MVNVACLLCSIYAGSRAFTLGYVISILYLLTCSEINGFTCKRKAAFSVVVFAVSAFLTICLKKDSSMGRILIYKVSWNMFCSNPYLGIGSGSFQTRYGLYQAAYFHAGKYSVKEFLLADNTYYAFNDYWQLIIEHGLFLGVAGIVCFFYAIFKLHASTSKKGCPELTPVKLCISQVVAIATAALFTHVMERMVIQVVLTLVISYIIAFSLTKKLRHQLLITTLIFVAFLVMRNLTYLTKLSDYRRLDQARELAKFGFINDARKICHGVYPSLKHDLEFLLFYCDLSEPDEDQNRTVTLLRYTLTKWTSNTLYMKLGDKYLLLNHLQEAECSYLRAVDLVPNRFTTRYRLFEFYLNTAQITKAKAVAKVILTMPEKVPSSHVEFIKNNVKRKLILLG
ncbi:O-antigen ligase family protein [Mucilaginibacter sp. UYCu711]|uniref:O-antigen ligase family protein n=1 Tax=Mucilaginibacter sp. UYCu711 TaxID=3156339 RepID=UPI003D237D5C